MEFARLNATMATTFQQAAVSNALRCAANVRPIRPVPNAVQACFWRTQCVTRCLNVQALS